MIEHLGDAPFSGETHGGVHRLHVDRLMRRALVQQTQRVAHAAVGEARDQLRRVGAQVEALLFRDGGEIVRDARNVDAAEAVPLAAGQDRRGDLLQLRRRENEHQVRRRLLQNLQQRVEGRGREHVHLVHDVHALFDRRGREDGFFPQGAHVVHAVIRGRVQLHHVHDRPLADAAAGGAGAAGVPVHGVLAVDGLGEDARAGGLAGAAGADEDIGMGKAVVFHLIFQRLGDMLLPNDLIEGLRPPFSVQGLIHRQLPFPKILLYTKSVALDKTAHPAPNRALCPLRRQPARIRRPRGTSQAPLNAARFPA